MPNPLPQNPRPALAPDELAGIGFFEEFGPEARAAIAPFVEISPLGAGTPLFRQGEPYRGVMDVIRAGGVRQVWQDGKVMEKRTGEVLGLSGYLDNRPYRSTVTALVDTELLRVPAGALRRLEAGSRPVADAMNRAIAGRIHARATPLMEVAPLSGLSVSQAMKTPLIACSPETTLHEAYRLMRERRIGSLAILDEVDDGPAGPMGLLTCAELYEAVLEKGLSKQDTVISAAFQRPRGIPATASLGEAERLQRREGVKYLIVTEQDRPMGILSQTDILRAAASVSPTLLAEAQRAEGFAALGELHRRLPAFAANMRNWRRSAMATIRVLNEAHRAILQRCAALTLAEMTDRGKGGAPAPFALVLLGSGGRGEMLLTPDQDNALLLGDGIGKDPGAVAWFADFSAHLNRRMAQVGYGLCPGGVMARNPAWRKRLSDWKRQMGRIIAHPNPKAARWSNIALDMKHLYGEEALLRALRREIAERLQENPRLLRMMVEDDAEGRPPLGLFNRLITTTAAGKKGRIDVKRNALRIVADAARVYAWRVGLDVNNTLDRLQGVARQGTLSHEFVETTLAAYDALLDLYLDQRLERTLGEDGNGAEDGRADKLLDHDLLNAHEQDLLRISLRAVKRLQRRLQDDFGVG